MRLAKRLVWMASAVLLGVAVGASFAPAPPLPPPVATASLSPGGMTLPPPDPAAVEQVFKMIDANHDGKLQLEEVKAWVRQAWPERKGGEPPVLKPARLALTQRPPPPPQAGRPLLLPNPAAVAQVFEMIDANKDGALQLEEVKAWAIEARFPGPRIALAGLGAGLGLAQPQPVGISRTGDRCFYIDETGVIRGTTEEVEYGTPSPDPPPCSKELTNKEQEPAKYGVLCNGMIGNLFYRTVCHTPGFDTQTITLLAGHAAACFWVEAITPGAVWGIRVEGGATIYQSGAGPGPLKELVITDTGPSDTGKYTVFLDTAHSAPGARVTVRFVDYSKSYDSGLNN